MFEIWKNVVGYEGVYTVSDQGRVKRIRGGQGAIAGKILKFRFNSDGYPMVWLCRDGTQIQRRVHRLVLEAFVGFCPKGMECCHYDGNRANPKLENLRWDTRSANAKDAFGHGTRSQCGSHNSNSKLTIDNVLEIRRLLFEGNLNQGEIGLLFGVSSYTISDIHTGRKWKHV